MAIFQPVPSTSLHPDSFRRSAPPTPPVRPPVNSPGRTNRHAEAPARTGATTRPAALSHNSSFGDTVTIVTTFKPLALLVIRFAVYWSFIYRTVKTFYIVCRNLLLIVYIFIRTDIMRLPSAGIVSVGALISSRMTFAPHRFFHLRDDDIGFPLAVPQTVHAWA